MNSERRRFLGESGLMLATLGLVSSGFFNRARANSELWDSTAFGAEEIESAIKEIVGVNIFPHADVSIIAPEIAENGAVVPVGVEVSIPNISKIAILCEKNPHPLAALYDLSEGTVANIRTRIKMAETSRVVVIAKSGDKFYSADKLIKVTRGGCGG